MNSKTLGVLGGLGPMSGVWFQKMLIDHTKAESDQDHLNVIVSSRADTPDRTAYILGRSDKNPLPVMRAEVSKLMGAGADIIAIPCNTAHYFYEGISESASVPVINIIKQTALFCKRQGLRRVGLLATEGTVRSGAYSSLFASADIECICPDENEQRIITDIIYGQIKRGLPADTDAFYSVVRSMEGRGCEKIILGCTELSLLRADGAASEDIYIDALEVLAYCAIRMCGKTPVGFDEALMNFRV